MPSRPIVPERNRALFPFKARLEFRPCRMLVQEIQKWPALFFGPSLEVGRERGIDIKCMPSGFGMADHDRMDSILGCHLRIDIAIFFLWIRLMRFDPEDVPA